MKEKTTLADRYFFEHFYQTCTAESRTGMSCRGVELRDGYSWIGDKIDRRWLNCGLLGS